jgi:hypothetical protein
MYWIDTHGGVEIEDYLTISYGEVRGAVMVAHGLQGLNG